jgi:thiamine-monophosphate kinase
MTSGEFDLIARLRERLPAGGPRLRVGSGDDAAVTDPAGAAAATTIDALVEGVHFTLPEFPLRAVGRKALAAALSDLAAMGAEPGEAYVALAAPARLGEAELLEIADGLAEVARREHVDVAGGDLTRASELGLCVACVGYERPGTTLVTRAGARPGDVLVVTGELGGAAAGLKLLAGDVQPALDAPTREALLARQLEPRPRIAAGRSLAIAGAGAMIDVSDGLGADAGHLAAASGVTLTIDLERLPLAAGAAAVAGGEGGARELALGGGEDYELLACLPPERLEGAVAEIERAGYRLTAIGEADAGEPGLLRDRDGQRIEPSGFDHMRGSRSGSDSGSGAGSRSDAGSGSP